MDYQDLNDYELLNYVKENIEEANEVLFDKYMPLVNLECTDMLQYVAKCGVDRNDLIQEGLLALTNAINTYEEKKDNTFYTYAKTCIRRGLVSFVIKSNRQKHKILNESLSYDNPEGSFDKILKDNNDPLSIIIESSFQENVVDKIKSKLTNFESEVFELMLSNFKYKEIANILDKDIKSIDNAMQRIRLKAKAVINK